MPGALHAAMNNKKNALHPQMQNEIAFCFDYISQNKEIRLVIIQSSGDTFSAGADLKALSNNVEPHNSTIPKPNKKIILGNLFSNLYKPKLAVVEGNVYAGGTLIVAGCNYVISLNDITDDLTLDVSDKKINTPNLLDIEVLS